jgi:hypothetical protein
MWKLMTKNITKIGVLLPIISLVFGVIIINLSLNKYGIVEYSIFQIQSILTGSVYIVILYFLVVYYTLILSKFKNKIIFMLLASFVSSVFITAVFYHLFSRVYNNINLFNFTLTSKTIEGLLTITLISIVGAFVFLDYIKNNDPEGILFNGTKHRLINVLMLLAILIIPSFFVLIISFNTLLFNKEFKNLLAFFTTFSFFITGLIYGVGKIKKHNKGYENDNSILNLNIGIVYIASFVIYITFLYSSNVYQHLPKNYGGGKAEQAKITYNNGLKIEGSLLHSNSNLIFIKQKDKLIKVIEWNKLESIERIK